MRTHLFSLLVLVPGLCATVSHAATALGIREASPEASATAQVPVTLTSTTPVVAMQADVLYNESLYDVGDATGGSQPDGVLVQSRKISTGTLRVVIYHRSGAPLASDVLFQIPLTAKAGVVNPDPIVLTGIQVAGQGGGVISSSLIKLRLVGLRNGGAMNGRQGIELSANASITNGSISKIEYYVGGEKKGEGTGNNFTFLWEPDTSGPFEVVAIAYDNNGQQITSRTIPVIVTHVGTYMGDNDRNGPVIVTHVGTYTSPVLGSYYGLVRGQAFNFANDGYVTMTSALSKAFTLKLLVGGKSWSTSGKFDDAGNATATIKRGKGITDLTIVLAQSSSPLVDQIHGRVADGSFANGKFSGNTFETEFTVNRVTWKTKTNESPQSGPYTMLIPAHVNAGTQAAPLGTGYGTVTVGKDGSAKLAGSLADGTTLTASSFISKNGFWPVYASLYGNKGVILGEVAFGDIEGISDFSGPLTWMRPADTKAAMFKTGFGTTVNAIGSRFVKPTVNKRIFPLANSGGNSLLFLTDGGLPADLERLALLTAANKGIIPTQGADAATLVPAPATGLLSGAFMHEGTQKSVAYKGAVMQKQNMAAGYFLTGPLGGDMAFHENPDLPPGTGDDGPIGTNPLPVVKISTPAAKSTLKLVTGNKVQIKGTASDKQGISSVKIQVLHNGVLSPAVNAVGTTSWTYDLDVPDGEGGLYTIFAKAIDSSAAADESEVLSHPFWTPLKSTLTVAVNDPAKGKVSTGFLGTSQRDVGKTFTITATPNSKKKFLGWTGSVVSSAPKITVLMEAGTTLTANFGD